MQLAEGTKPMRQLGEQVCEPPQPTLLNISQNASVAPTIIPSRVISDFTGLPKLITFLPSGGEACMPPKRIRHH